MSQLQSTLDSYIKAIKQNGTVNYSAVARSLKDVLNAQEIDAKTIIERTGDLDASLDYQYHVQLTGEPKTFKLPASAIHYSPLSYLLCALTEEQLEAHLPKLVDGLDDKTKGIFLNGEYVETRFDYTTPTEEKPVLTTNETQTIYKPVDLLAKLSKVGCVKELIPGERNTNIEQRNIEYRQEGRLTKDDVWVINPLNNKGVVLDENDPVLKSGKETDKAYKQTRLMKLNRVLQTTTNTNRVHVIGYSAVPAPVLQEVQIVATEYKKEEDGDDFEKKLNERLAPIYQAYKAEKEKIQGDQAKRLLSQRNCIAAVDQMVKENYSGQDPARVYALLNTPAGETEYHYIRLMKSVVTSAVTDTTANNNIVETVNSFTSLTNALMFREIQHISDTFDALGLSVFEDKNPRTLNQLHDLGRVVSMFVDFVNALTYPQYRVVSDWILNSHANAPFANFLAMSAVALHHACQMGFHKGDRVACFCNRRESSFDLKKAFKHYRAAVDVQIKLKAVADTYAGMKRDRTIGKSGNPAQSPASAKMAERLKLDVMKLLKQSQGIHRKTLIDTLYSGGSREQWTRMPGTNNWESNCVMTVLVSLLCHQKNAFSRAMKYPESYQIVRDMALGRAGANERFEAYITGKEAELNPPQPTRYSAEVQGAVGMHLSRR